ncbi:DgyrCDS13045 [Dimorphilus gyrociliatus]|uniref:DgyrCDS13045 n=1 Tax=Dimorphilus gyrociliatus TaxID=2664684 RepID=A0A7I8W9H0_9ANNE|nr:DgyrCDS13045 [Dimorphilus gyrociliatus]
MAAEMTDKDPATISLSGDVEKKQASKESLPETREVNIHQRDPANINDYIKRLRKGVLERDRVTENMRWEAKREKERQRERGKRRENERQTNI